jgi:uncharacterized protein YjbI with pentapeptide repeats
MPFIHLRLLCIALLLTGAVKVFAGDEVITKDPEAIPAREPVVKEQEEEAGRALESARQKELQWKSSEAQAVVKPEVKKKKAIKKKKSVKKKRAKKAKRLHRAPVTLVPVVPPEITAHPEVVVEPAPAAQTVDSELLEIARTTKNFAGRKLSGASFIGMDLRRADFRRADLARADFTRANLQQADFEQAKMNNSTFVHANLNISRIKTALVNGADFSGARWVDGGICAYGSTGDCRKVAGNGEQGVPAVESDIGVLSKAVTSQKVVTPVEVDEILAGSRDFSGRNLSWFDFTGYDLRRVNFERALLVGAKFDRADLQEANFSLAMLDQASFAAANLNLAKFTGARLMKTNFSAARWTGGRLCASGSVDGCSFSGN